MVTTSQEKPNRHDRRHSDELPELLTKSQAAELLQCSTRQIELLTKREQIAKPIYLSERAPRWRRAELLASLGTQAAEDEAGQ